MRLIFNERKAAQAAARLIRRHGGRLNYMALIKLLVLADRHALLETGYTITGDRIVAMSYGLVLSKVYERINVGMDPDLPPAPWFEYISPPMNYEVSAIGAGEDDELSDYERTVLDETDTRFGHLNQWKLGRLTHELPEFVEPHGSSVTITPEDILQKAGMPADEIRRISSDAEAVFLLDRFIKR